MKLKVYKRGSKLIPFASDAGGQEELFRYLRENPHKYNLGRIGFYSQINGPRLSLSDIETGSAETGFMAGNSFQ